MIEWLKEWFQFLMDVRSLIQLARRMELSPLTNLGRGEKEPFSTRSAALMKQFYVSLKKGQDKGSALRRAKIDLLKKYGDQALPYYWAGFTLQGESAAPISFSK